MLQIDRLKSFDPVKWLGRGYKIAEQDERALALVEADLSMVRFVTCIKVGETINGEERLRRLKTLRYIRLDAKVFQMLWENKNLIPESWKKRINGRICFILFNGTILLDPVGDRCVIYLVWYDGWTYGDRSLGRSLDDNKLSAVLTSIS